MRECSIEKLSEGAVSVVLAANDEYAPYLDVTIRSIAHHACPDRIYDIIVLHSDISEINRRKISTVRWDKSNVSVRFFNVSSFFQAEYVLSDPHLTKETYYRLIIPDLMSEYDRVIYLDSDLVINRDIAELFNTELNGKAIAAVRDVDLAGLGWFRIYKWEEYVNRVLGIERLDDYFQAGVLLFDIEAVRSVTSAKELIRLSEEGGFRFNDQDILNMILKGRVNYLPQKWNVMMNWKEPEKNRERMQTLMRAPADLFAEYLEAREDPWIIHYSGVQKPWKVYDCDMAEGFWLYASKSPYYNYLSEKTGQMPAPVHNKKKTLKNSEREYITRFDYTKQPGRNLSRFRGAHAGRPLVTVITPFFNAGDYFEQTFNCVMNQTFPWFEWIIVDDGSTDKRSLEMLESFSFKDDRIRVYHKENGGISSARNLAILHAETEYIQLLDADDLIEPTYMEYCFWMLKKDPDAAWAYTDSCGFGRDEYLLFRRYDPQTELRVNMFPAFAMVRKEWLVKSGLFCEKEKYCNEDWLMWLSIMAGGGYPVQSTGEPLAWYRRKEGGVYDIVRYDNAIYDRNLEMVRKLADDITSPMRGRVFPDEPVSYINDWREPRISDFDRKSGGSYRERINVLFILPFFSIGGADRMNLELLSGLDRGKYCCHVVTTVKDPNRMLQTARAETDDVFNLPNFMDPEDYPEFISYIIKTREIDVLFICNSYLGYILLPFFRKHFPKLHIVDYVHNEEMYWRGGGYARLSGTMGALLDRTYTASEETRKKLISMWKRESDSIVTVPIGTDPDRFDPEKVRKGIVREQLDIGVDRPIVLFISRFHPQKRPLMMLSIAERVRREIPEVAFVAVGYGELYREMIEKAEKMDLADTVYFAGETEDPRPYYKDAAVSLNCSLIEGLALTTYESLAMEVPVISADTGWQYRLVDDKVGKLIPLMQDAAGDYNAKHFPEKEIMLYTSAIVDILRNAEFLKRAGKTGRKRIIEGFRAQNMIDYFDKELQDITENKPQTAKNMITSDMLTASGMIPELFYSENLVSQGKSFEESAVSENRFRMLEKNQERQEEDLRKLWEISGKHDQIFQKQEGEIERLSESYHQQEEAVSRHEEVVNRHEEVVNRHEEVVNRHEEVVNRHEEVVNRHEEVVNRHEASINHQWGVQKWHEERISALENGNNKAGLMKRILSRIKGRNG